MKKALIRTADQAQNLTDDSQVTPSEYTGDKLQYGMEDLIAEGGHLVVDSSKSAFKTSKTAIQKFREKRNAAAKKKLDDLHHTAPEVPTEPPNSAERLNAATKGPKGKTMQARKSTRITAARHEPTIKSLLHPGNRSIKTAPKVERSIRQSARSTGKATIKTAENAVKGTQKAIKTAEHSSRVAIKTAQATAKTAKRSAQAAAKTAEKTRQIARVAAKAAAAVAKASAKAVVSAVKAIMAGIKSLVGAIAAGGGIAVAIIIVIMFVAMLVGSVFGIFFSSEDTGSDMSMRDGVQEINSDYQSRILSIRSNTTYDNVEASGSRAVWPEVLAVYAVKVNYDPNNPQEVATMDSSKKATLEQIFWEMNSINYYVATHEETVVEENADANGNITEVETTMLITTLYITVSHKTAEEMADEYGFTAEQRVSLSELLVEENASMWSSVLYGIHNADSQIVAVAASQLGNVGGEPYWSWYGFGSRVEWCACFVSWCANECDYIDLGVIPKFAGCGVGADWFIERGQWADGSYTPQAGDIIFFDWDGAGGQDGTKDHVGIVEKVEDGYVYTIEGNSGDSCARRSYPVGWYEIVGYGLPAY